MNDKKFVVDTNLGIVKYIATVEDIVEEFFDEHGFYVPHWGKLNAMRIFYNNCVSESKYDLEYIIDAQDMEPLAEDSDFIAEFNKALNGDGKVKFDFSNAYSDAINIVNNKKSSFESVIESIKKLVYTFMDKMSPILDELDMDKLMKIATDLKDGAISADSIVEAYGKSKVFMDTITAEK